VIALVGPTGVFDGEMVPIVMGAVTTGMVCVPEERE
jgi:hypothetical protein